MKTKAWEKPELEWMGAYHGRRIMGVGHAWEYGHVIDLRTPMRAKASILRGKPANKQTGATEFQYVQHSTHTWALHTTLRRIELYGCEVTGVVTWPLVRAPCMPPVMMLPQLLNRVGGSSCGTVMDARELERTTTRSAQVINTEQTSFPHGPWSHVSLPL